MSQLLSNATVQEIQLELLKRASRDDAMDGEQVVASLLKHRDLWVAVMLASFCFSNPGRLPSVGLIKLRDLNTNFWNADKLFAHQTLDELLDEIKQRRVKRTIDPSVPEVA